MALAKIGKIASISRVKVCQRHTVVLTLQWPQILRVDEEEGQRALPTVRTFPNDTGGLPPATSDGRS